jgi:hypothetical protein
MGARKLRHENGKIISEDVSEVRARSFVDSRNEEGGHTGTVETENRPI